MPGAGKSTLVDQLAKFCRRIEANPTLENHEKRGTRLGCATTIRYTVGIIAVDPTSPTPAARSWATDSMQEHFADPGIYIRSRRRADRWVGWRGRRRMSWCDASGRDLVMIETVGVGRWRSGYCAGG